MMQFKNVKSVRRVIRKAPTSVYDIEVSRNSNFVLANGLVLHNSKDLTDAVSGSVFAAYKMYLKFPGAYSLQQHTREKEAMGIR